MSEREARRARALIESQTNLAVDEPDTVVSLVAHELVTLVAEALNMAVTIADKRLVPVDVWFKFDHEDDEDPSHEANTFLTDDNRFRVEWSNTDVGEITEHTFDTYTAAQAWLEAAGYEDYTS